MTPLLSSDEAWSLVEKALPARSTEHLPLDEAAGLVLASDLQADRPFPPYDRAMMDGIACHSRDLPGPLSIQGLHAAGAPPIEGLPKGHCVEIMTGAVFPHSCDMLIPYEEIQIADGQASVTGQAPSVGKFIHRAGANAETGDVILKAGSQLNAAAINLAASAGYDKVETYRRQKIAIVSTGDELVDAATEPKPWQIRRSTPQALTAALKSCCPEEVSTYIVSDDFAATVTALKDIIRQYDFVLITGGISRGKRDFIRPALEKIQGPPIFHGVAQRPGKPLAVWKSDDEKMIFALPGNPTSSLNCATRYVLPALRKQLGLPARSHTIHLDKTQANTTKFTHFYPASLVSHTIVTIHSPQNSGDELSPALATGFVEIPPLSAPSEVTYHPFT